MSNIRFDAPPKGADLYSWMFRLAQDLNLAFTSIDEQNMTPEAAAVVSAGGAAQAAREEAEKTATALKGLIIKTATEVRHEMDLIVQELQSEYVAASEFGEYKQIVNTAIATSATDITQSIMSSDTITGMQESINGFNAYRVNVEGFIKQGIVGYKSDGVTPLVGIAIGQGVETTGQKGQDEDGNEWDIIDTTSSMAIYTSEGLEFYVNGTRAAYLSNRRLYITDASIAGNLDQGSWKWEQSAGTGLTLRYVG